MPKENTDWLRLNDVPAYYYHQTNTKVVNVETVRWWIKHGKRDYGGNLTKLKHQIRNGLWMTRKAWVDEFIMRMTFNEVS